MLPELVRIRRRWLFALPITALCVISIAFSTLYAWNLAGPYEYRFPYAISVGSLISSVLLIVSTVTTWRLIKSKARSVRSWRSSVGILVGVMPACYYLWYANLREPVDFSVGLIAMFTIVVQIVLWKIRWHSTTDPGGPSIRS